MAFEHKERPDDTLALFKNDDRRDDRDPLYKGQGKVNGRDFWASAWVNESRKNGSKYLSIKLKPKQEQRRETYNRQKEEVTHTRGADFDDEIPF